MVIEVDPNRPYTPVANVVSVLQRLRTRNLPETINVEYLRDASIPEGTISRTLFALRFLGLIDEYGTLLEPLKAIHTSTDEEYQEILAGLIRTAYKEVFNVVDPGQDTQDKVLNVFRRYLPASQRERMVAFFLGMCREAGIPTLDVPKARSMTASAPANKQQRKPTPNRTHKARKPESDEQPQLDIAPALEGLIRSLPKPGESLSKERREKWVEMAKATLEFVYPEPKEEENKPKADIPLNE